MPYRLSSLAEADLDDIRAFSLERWAQEQWQSYYRNLALAFGRIAENPAVGRKRDVLRPGLRSLPCGSHIIFYGLLPSGVVGIARILHQRQSAEALRAADRSSSQPFPFPAAFSFARRASVRAGNCGNRPRRTR